MGQLDPRIHYFRAGGSTLDYIREWGRQMRAWGLLVAEIAESIGGKPLTTGDGRRWAVDLPVKTSSIPEGWRRDGKKGWIVPDNRTRIGRELVSRVRAVAPHDSMEVAFRLFGDHGIHDHESGRVYFPGWEWFEDGAICVVSQKVPPSVEILPPPDCEPMLASEYWRLWEADARWQSDDKLEMSDAHE